MDQEPLFSYFRGETTPQEEERILAWIEASEDNRREFRKAHVLSSPDWRSMPAAGDVAPRRAARTPDRAAGAPSCRPGCRVVLPGRQGPPISERTTTTVRWPGVRR